MLNRNEREVVDRIDQVLHHIPNQQKEITMTTLNDLDNEVRESICVHHSSGHFAREEPIGRLGSTGLDLVAAERLLDEPVDPALFDVWKTYPKE